MKETITTQPLTESAFANSKDMLPIFEVDDNKHQVLNLYALSADGHFWSQVCTIRLDQEGRYRTPLLLRFGYSQLPQSVTPEADTMPQ